MSSVNVTLRFCNHFSLFEVIMLSKWVRRIPELNWNKPLRDKETSLKICRQVLTSSTQRQKQVISRRGKNENGCEIYKTTLEKRAKLLFFIVKFENL